MKDKEVKLEETESSLTLCGVIRFWGFLFVHYESITRDLKIRTIQEYRCDERLKTKAEESTRLTFIGLIGELEHLKIKIWLKDEKFESVVGECEFVKV
jgi:hypothetical protein